MSRAATPRYQARLGAVLLAAVIGLCQPSSAYACPDGAIADSAGAAFLNAAKAGTAQAFANALATYTNMDQITFFALGRYGGQVPSQRRAEIVRLSANYVSTTLADFALKFRGTAIKTVECRSGQVVSRLELGARPAKRVVWRINGGKITDVNIQNVWLAQLLRDNYASIIQKGGGSVDALFAHLGAKVSADMGNR